MSANRSILRWVFPPGAVLTVGGVFLCALLEWHSFENTQDWEFEFLSVAFFLSLLVGSGLAIVGSVLDRRRLSPDRSRIRGTLCWVVSGISILLLTSMGNVHRWTFTFIFPAFVGLVTGAIFLRRATNNRSETQQTHP